MHYYDHHALVTLDRPVAIAGFLTEDNRAVALRVAALTGLGHADVDRLIEHREGTSIASLLATEGETAYRRLERETLATALRSAPYGVISLGDGALLAVESRELLQQSAHLALLDLSFDAYCRRLAALRGFVDRPPTGDAGYTRLPPAPGDEEELRRLWEERHLTTISQGHRVDASYLSHDLAAEALLSSVPSLRPN